MIILDKKNCDDDYDNDGIKCNDGVITVHVEDKKNIVVIVNNDDNNDNEQSLITMKLKVTFLLPFILNDNQNTQFNS